jgi:hypothetical protein
VPAVPVAPGRIWSASCRGRKKWPGLMPGHYECAARDLNPERAMD